MKMSLKPDAVFLPFYPLEVELVAAWGTPNTTHLDTCGAQMARQSVSATHAASDGPSLLGGGSARLRGFRIPLFLPNEHTRAAADKSQEQRLV